jgi:hypothetical protein
MSNVSQCSLADRKKDLVKLQLGEYVSLGKVESELKTCPAVENICVYGDANKAYTVALIVPNSHYLEEIASNLGIISKSFEELCSNPQIEKVVLQDLVEQAKKCTYFHADCYYLWPLIIISIVESGGGLKQFFDRRQTPKVRDTGRSEIVRGTVVARYGPGNGGVQAQTESGPRTLPARD